MELIQHFADPVEPPPVKEATVELVDGDPVQISGMNGWAQRKGDWLTIWGLQPNRLYTFKKSAVVSFIENRPTTPSATTYEVKVKLAGEAEPRAWPDAQALAMPHEGWLVVQRASETLYFNMDKVQFWANTQNP